MPGKKKKGEKKTPHPPSLYGKGKMIPTLVTIINHPGAVFTRIDHTIWTSGGENAEKEK